MWILLVLFFSSAKDVAPVKQDKPLPQGVSLTPELVVKRSIEHFPSVIQSLMNVEKAEGALMAFEGAFDGKIKGEYDSRIDGYYDGRGGKAQISQPFQTLDAEIYGGWRVSRGEYPSYEGKAETLEDGETFFGASLSLLRGAYMNLRRFKVQNAEEDLKQQQILQKQVELQVQTQALRAYWLWMVSGHELKVYEDLLSLAEQRASQINKRIKAGDLAAIYGVENRQYIQKRAADKRRAMMKWQEASLYLSLFYRDEGGKLIMPVSTQLPAYSMKRRGMGGSFEVMSQRAMEVNPDLKVILSKMEQARNKVRLGWNDILPTLNARFERTEDRGTVNDVTLGGVENRIQLQLEVPIRYRKGIGKRQEGNMELRILETKKNFTIQKMEVALRSLMMKRKLTDEVIDITKDQIDMAKKLTAAERTKFRQGDSDLILVNIREESLGEARIKNLQSYLKYQYIEADIKLMTMTRLNESTSQ